MTQVLERVTTEFCPPEDRMRMAGMTNGGKQVVIWLTRRMLSLLLPVVLRRFDELSASVSPEHRQILQEFAQQAARDSMEAPTPVQAGPECEAILPTSVDVAHDERHVALTFRDEGVRSFRLTLDNQALRQWLQMLHQADCAADWQLSQWPDWIAGPAGHQDSVSALALH
ncbi:hypothetical protein ACHMW6_29225 [Pseudoduganella sp. UC29_106]|uniref:hypothetical protein n=1 Tax=Pseudoduganella sp. UC29_106 TaxID=3374553 RepID=UPI00375637E0